MVACVRDPIDGWGGGQAPMHQVKSASCTPPIPRDHVGEKRRAYMHDQVGGWGIWREMKPPPTPSEVMPRCDPQSPVCAAALQKALTKQS